MVQGCAPRSRTHAQLQPGQTLKMEIQTEDSRWSWYGGDDESTATDNSTPDDMEIAITLDPAIQITVQVRGFDGSPSLRASVTPYLDVSTALARTCDQADGVEDGDILVPMDTAARLSFSVDPDATATEIAVEKGGSYLLTLPVATTGSVEVLHYDDAPALLACVSV